MLASREVASWPTPVSLSVRPLLRRALVCEGRRDQDSVRLGKPMTGQMERD